MDWAVETESECGSWARLGVSGTVFGPVAQDEGLCGRSGPGTATDGSRPGAVSQALGVSG